MPLQRGKNYLYLIFALVLVLAFSQPAKASWRVDRSLAIAQIVWHPSCDLRLSFDDPAQAHGMLPDGTEVVNPAGWAIKGDCTIHLSRTYPWIGFEDFCTVVLREGGNVVGAGDNLTAKPNSIRYPIRTFVRTQAVIGGRLVERWSGVDWRCLGRGRPFLEAHGVIVGAARMGSWR